ncbi:MAG: SH3 domain-containing protein [Anaerolineales bacterium]|nr:SH3 domain-containing protein [Anaerolineales bacterium]
MKFKSRSQQVWILLLLLLSIFLLVNQAFAQNVTKTAVQTNPTAVVNTGALNVRSGPGIGYDIVTVVNQGVTVTLLGRNANSTWAKIQVSDGRQGWVNASLISPSVAISTLAVITDTPDLTAAATVATGALNVRSGPGVTYSVLTVAGYGHTVGLLGRNSNSSWAKVRLSNGQEGWVNASLITPNVSISSLPIADAPAPPEPPVPVAPNALLSLRAGPSLSDTVIGQVYQGQRVQAIGRNDSSTWVKVRVLETGLEGWISVAFVQADVIISNLPVMTGSTIPAATATSTPIATPTPTTSTSGTAVVTASALNLRTGPGIGYGVVTVVYQGHTVTLLGRNSSSSWVKVRTSAGQEGWMNVQYLTSGTAINSLPVIDAATLTAVGTVNTGALNVRSGPGIEYTATAVVFQGTSIGLIGRNSNSSWVKVRLSNDHVGWVNAAYINTVTTINSLPVTN